MVFTDKIYDEFGRQKVVPTINGNPVTSTNPIPVTSTNPIPVDLLGHDCTDNSYHTNLDADEVFDGEWEDTLNYNNIIVGIKSSHDSATDGLSICWSADGITEHDNDVFTIIANKSKVFTFCPARRYFKVSYTNGGTITTEFSLQTIMKKAGIKPSSHRINDIIVGQDDAELTKSVLTGLSTDGDGFFYNVKVTPDGSQLVKLTDSQNEKEIYITPTRDIKMVTPVKLAGTSFNGVKDVNFWTETVTGSGTVTAGGQITLSTGTTANSTAKYISVRKGRYVPGAFNQFRCIAQTNDIGTTDNLRRIGVYSATDGFFYQINGNTFQIGSRRNSTDTLISSGSFNGNLGADFVLDTSIHRLNIDYGNLTVYFYVNDILLHKMSSTTPLTNTLTLPITFENINSNGLTTNITFNVRTAAIMRLGELHTNPIYKSIITNATTICKYGAGHLHSIINCDNAGNITVYDNTAASGTIIAQIDTAKALGSLLFNCPFSNGLTVVTTGGAKITVVYE